MSAILQSTRSSIQGFGSEPAVDEAPDQDANNEGNQGHRESVENLGISDGLTGAAVEVVMTRIAVPSIQNCRIGQQKSDREKGLK